MAHETDFSHSYSLSQADFCGLFWGKKSKDESFLHLPSNEVVCFLTCVQNQEYISSAAFSSNFSLWQFLSSLECRTSECSWEAPGLLQPCSSVVWANKPRAAFPQQGFMFFNNRFQMSPGLEDADGIAWLRVRSNFVNSKGLSTLLSLFCQIWAGQIITCDNFTTLRNKVVFFFSSDSQSSSWKVGCQAKGLAG